MRRFCECGAARFWKTVGGDMQGKFGILGVMLLLARGMAQGQNAAPSLQDQLSAQYKLVKMGVDSTGPSVIEAGTILTIQKGGILGFANGNMAVLPAKYQNGTLTPPALARPNSAGKAGAKICGLFGKCSGVKDSVSNQATTRLFQVGEKVYPSKLEVNSNNDTVALSLVACDSCNKTDPPTFYKAQVVFQFAKGYLATASVPKVEDTMAEVLSLDQGGDSQQGQDNQGGQDQQNGQDQQGGQQQGQQQQQQQQQAPASSEEKGQTIDQVVAAWGQPQRKSSTLK